MSLRKEKINVIKIRSKFRAAIFKPGGKK